MSNADLMWKEYLKRKAERMNKLETLRVAVIIACGPGPWTDKRAEDWRELTGEDVATYAHLGRMAEEIGA